MQKHKLKAVKYELKRVLWLFAAMLFLQSCALNSIFLRPTKLSSKTTTFSLKTKNNETISVHFGENHQPVFLKENQDTVELEYTIKSVVFKNQTGKLLNGWEIMPKALVQPVATIVHFHGNAGSLLHQFNAVTPLVKEGFAVFMFDYSGFGFSEGRPTRKNVLKDGNAALDYVLTNFSPAKKIVLYGQSLGGHLAGVVGTQRQKDIDALVIEGAFSSHKTVAQAFAGGFGKAFTKEMYSAKDSIAHYHKPLLVIHSTEDEVIPFEMGKEIFNKANHPKEFLEVKECHICAPNYYTQEIADKIKTMLGL